MTSLPASLQRLEDLWTTAGMTVPDYFGPGLASESIVDLLRQSGLAASDEVVEWFSWHNGGGASPQVGSPLGPSGWDALSLQQALSARTDRLEGAVEMAEDFEGVPASHWWADAWPPIADNGGQDALAIELSPNEATTKVRVVGWDDPEDFPQVRAGSLTELVALWISALESGNWSWDGNRNAWTGDRQTLPRERYIFSLMQQ
jgi:cell wall assembly regulator SMI1